jgi:hypothetical protein
MQNTPQRIHVTTRVDVTVGEPLRRHVGQRPDRRTSIRQPRIGDSPGNPEIDQIRVIVLVEQDVGRLDVTVNQPDLVRSVQCRGDLFYQPDRTPGRERPLGQHRGQVMPLDQTHVHEQPSVDLPIVVDRQNVRVVQLRRSPRASRRNLFSNIGSRPNCGGSTLIATTRSVRVS